MVQTRFKKRGTDVTQQIGQPIGDDGKALQLYFNNEVEPAGLPNGGYSIKVDDDLSVTVGYKQSYDLADYYVAYNPGLNKSLVYDAIAYDPDGQKDKTYKNLTGNPIEVRKSWSDGSTNRFTSVIGVQKGLS